MPFRALTLSYEQVSPVTLRIASSECCCPCSGTALFQIHVVNGLVAANLLRSALGDLSALVEHEDPVGGPHDRPHFVADLEDGEALALEGFDHGADLLGLRRHEAADQLIEQDQPG